MSEKKNANFGWGTPQIVVVAILAVLVIALGALQLMAYLEPNYKAQVRFNERKIDTLETNLGELRQANALLSEQLGESMSVGFEVQIGAFQKYDIVASNAELIRMSRIENEGLNKYVLGRFSYFEDAEAFLSDIKTLGIQDAFIAGLVDGKRATVAEAKKAAKAYYGY